MQTRAKTVNHKMKLKSLIPANYTKLLKLTFYMIFKLVKGMCFKEPKLFDSVVKIEFKINVIFFRSNI